MFRVELQGLRPALSGLKRYRNPERLKLMKKAYRGAAAVIIAAMRRLVKRHDRTGTLRKSLTTKVKYYKNSDTLVVMIGVKSWAMGAYRGKTVIAHKYAHLVTRKRKAFTQDIDLKPGKKLVLSASPVRVISNKTGQVMRIKRRIGSYAGDNFIDAAIYQTQSAAIAKAKAIVAAGFK